MVMFVVSLYQISLPVPMLCYFSRSCWKVQKLVACLTVLYTVQSSLKRLRIFGKFINIYRVSLRADDVNDAAAKRE